MPRSDSSRGGAPACWDCGSELPTERLEGECVIHARRQERGGPYLSFRCPACRIDLGLLQDGRGGWLAYPLEDRGASSKLDFVYTRGERERLGRAREWWLRNEARVEAFPAVARAAPKPGAAGSRRAARPPPRTRRKPPPRPTPRPEPEPRAPPEPEPARAPAADPELRAPRDLLEVGPDADEKQIARAYRKALKLCHPDRVANLDPEFQDLAHRKAKALRRAYEALLDEVRRRDG